MTILDVSSTKTQTEPRGFSSARSRRTSQTKKPEFFSTILIAVFNNFDSSEKKSRSGVTGTAVNEAPSRIELLHKGFADLSLTAWVRRQFL